MDTKILNKYPTNSREYVNLIKIGVGKGFNVKCICGEEKIETIKENII
jgi:hypothetical protein